MLTVYTTFHNNHPPPPPLVPQVSFVMPSKFTLATLPRPHNPNVHIREVPARTMAAIAFGGNSPKEEQVEAT